jgi:hypothetical protein
VSAGAVRVKGWLCVHLLALLLPLLLLLLPLLVVVVTCLLAGQLLQPWFSEEPDVYQHPECGMGRTHL